MKARGLAKRIEIRASADDVERWQRAAALQGFEQLAPWLRSLANKQAAISLLPERIGKARERVKEVARIGAEARALGLNDDAALLWGASLLMKAERPPRRKKR